MDAFTVRFVVTASALMAMAIASALMVDAVYRRLWLAQVRQWLAQNEAQRESYERQLRSAYDEMAQLRAQLAQAQDGGAE